MWKLKAPIVDRADLPAALFDFFFFFLADDTLEHLCIESLKYVQLKGRKSLLLKVDMLNSQDTPCFRKYCRYEKENTADVQNITTSSLRSKNRFDKIMQNLYLANISNLTPNDKFSYDSTLGLSGSVVRKFAVIVFLITMVELSYFYGQLFH